MISQVTVGSGLLPLSNDPRVLSCGGGAYLRHPDGRWLYRWRAPVPGARDLVVADIEAVGGDPLAVAELFQRELTPREVALVADGGSSARPEARGRIVLGLQAPELHATAMIDVEQFAKLLGVTRATVDAYRTRGLLPEPQLQRGRTPLWAAPVVHRWVTSRPSRATERRTSTRVDVGRSAAHAESA